MYWIQLAQDNVQWRGL